MKPEQKTPERWILSILQKPEDSGTYDVKLSFDDTEILRIAYDSRFRMWMSGSTDPRRAALSLPILATWKVGSNLDETPADRFDRLVGRNAMRANEMEKLCIFCKNHEFHYEQGSACPTCGYDSMAKMTCKKHHWDLPIDERSKMADYRKMILMADACPDYKQVVTPNAKVKGGGQ